MQDIEINGTVIKPGEHKKLILNTYQLHTKTIIEIPIHVYRSTVKGPTMLISAGMHGDETNGIEILRKLVAHDNMQALKSGTVIAIPVINIVSFLYGSRDLPDGRDLNRCFPGNKNGSLGSRIAYDLMKHIIPLIDFGVDFHTGGAKINNYPQIRCVYAFPENVALAEKFSPPLIIDSSYREGTFRKEAAKKNKPILVYEGGESLRFDYNAINEGVNGCLRLMKEYGMIESEVPPNPYVKIIKGTWVRAKMAGLFHFNKSNGSFVDKNELLGVICNPYGDVEAKVLASISGYVVGVNNQPVVNEGDALVHLGSTE